MEWGRGSAEGPPAPSIPSAEIDQQLSRVRERAGAHMGRAIARHRVVARDAEGYLADCDASLFHAGRASP